MKRVILCVIAMLFAVGMKAYELTPEAALSRALKVMKNGRALKSSGALPEDYHLKYTEHTNAGAALYYIYENANGGFAIVGADSRAQSLLGYTDGSFEDLRKFPSFNDWLTDCAQALTWLSTQAETQSEVTLRSSETQTAVEPLLGNIAWSQEYPYNLDTPWVLTEEGDTVKAPTGCVATAMAQVMKYYNWPDVGVGNHTNEYFKEQTVDFTQSHYDWDNMLPRYTGNESIIGVQVTAVAKLMSDVGCAVDIMYGPTASSGHTENIAIALVRNFKYDRAAKFIERSCYDTETWNAILHEELNNKRPIIFSGQSSSNGHSFVIDGYDTNGLYHVNWGGNGFGNGYFDINYLRSDRGEYNSGQDAVIYVKPDYDNSSVATLNLRLSSHYSYSKWTQQFRYGISNESDLTFTGSAGFILLDDKGNEIDRMEQKMIDGKEIQFGNYYELEYSVPEDIEIKDGYRVTIFYKEEIGGEDHQYNIPLSAPAYYEAKVEDGNVEWVVPTDVIPQLTLENVEILRSYAGIPPCFNLTLSNDASSTYEYNKSIRVDIMNADSNAIVPLCYGSTQVFLGPGETKNVRVECDKTNKIKMSDLTPGDYKYVVKYIINNTYNKLDDYKPITLDYNPPSVLTYSDFAIDKSSVRKGDKLTASLTVVNEGGFELGTFFFCFFKEDEDGSRFYFQAECEVKENSSTQVILSGNVNLEPGTYKGIFFKKNDTGFKSISEAFIIVVDDPASVHTIEASKKIKNGSIYNLNGQRVNSESKGIVIMNGRKTWNR